jgi:putative membrane protein
MKTIHFAPASAALLSICCLASAQTSFTHDGRPERIFRPASGLNMIDGNFMRQAAFINMMELELAQVAETRGTSPFVKEYAKEMIINHDQDRAQLQALAQNKGFELPSNLPQGMQHSINFISSLSGNDFDAAYRQFMLTGHENAAAFFEHEVSAGHDQDVKGYAVIVLPEMVLSGHLAKVEKTRMGDTKEDHGI